MGGWVSIRQEGGRREGVGGGRGSISQEGGEGLGVWWGGLMRQISRTCLHASFSTFPKASIFEILRFKNIVSFFIYFDFFCGSKVKKNGL